MNAQESDIPAPFEIQQKNFKTYTFEKNVSSDFRAGPGSKISRSTKYYKYAKASLRWDWNEENAYIEYKNSKAFKFLTGQNPDPIVYEWVTFCTLSTFSIWVFSENEYKSPLWFEIGNSVKADTRFYMNMNFEGWALAEALYGRDLNAFPNQKTADTLRIYAPKGVKSGTIYLDSFCPRSENDVRRVRTTPQLPYVFNKNLESTQVKKLGGNASTSVIHKSVPDNVAVISIEKPVRLSAGNKALLDKMTDVYLNKFVPQVKRRPYTKKQIEEAVKLYDKFSIKRQGKFVSGNIGRPISFYAQMTRVARIYKTTGDERLKQLFFDMTELVIQNGHGAWYGLRTSFVLPIMLMKDELKAAGIFKPYIAKIKDIIGVDEFFEEAPFGNADDFNTELKGRVAAILMQDDDAKKWQELHALKHWLDVTSYNGEIKPDGSFFHHNMIYSGYNLPAIGPICQILNLTARTPFFSERMFLIARKSLLAMSFYSNDHIVHMYSGRWRDCPEFNWNLAQNLGLLAECNEQIDKRCAEEYLYYADRFNKKTSLVEKYKKAGVEKAEFAGNLALNYAVSSIHRRKNWMAVMRGMHKGIETNEAYANQGGNTMGRYINYGQIQIFTKDSPEKNGFPQGKRLTKGWDYNLFPGTTSRIIPLDALRQHFMNVEATTSETFAGATHLEGNGIFGMKLQEELPVTDDPLRLGPPVYWLGQKEYKRRCEASMYDTSFKARKSMFFFEDRIIALGSGIVSNDDKHKTVTTLFQNVLLKNNIHNFSENGKSGNFFPLEKTNSDSFWMVSAVGNGYYLPRNDMKVKIMRNFVKKPYYINWNPEKPEIHNQIEANEGNIEFAYIDHGKAPASEGYEYCILVDTDKEQMQDFVRKMGAAETALYKVLCRDENAHIVRDVPSCTDAYVMFEAGETKCSGILKKVDKPCLLMAKELSKDTVKISLYNPEYDDYSSFGSPVQDNAPVVLHLNGKWKLSSKNPQVTQNNPSELIVTGKDALPVVFEISKK